MKQQPMSTVMVEPKETQDPIFREGMTAYHDKLPKSMNPYNHEIFPEQYEMWLEGYFSAAKAKRGKRVFK